VNLAHAFAVHPDAFEGCSALTNPPARLERDYLW
jgi:hypothetical protein